MKKGILIPILIIIFLTLSCASASDLNGTTEDGTLTSNDDNIVENGLNDTLSISNEENLAATVDFDGTTFSQLQSKINSANNYDTIVLTKNVKQDGSSPIFIDKPITIDGRGFTIDGNNNGRMMTITGANVTLKNISFINGYDHEFMFGVGAIYWNAPNALLTHCNFTNIDGGHIGCVDWEGTNGTISYCNFKDCKGCYSNVRVVKTALYTTIDYCTFDNCIQTDNGRCAGIEWYAIYGLLNNTRFINCRGMASALYWTASNGKANNCSFIGNIHGQMGTVYWIGGAGVLNNSNFINNQGPSSMYQDYKGILYWTSGNSIISNCNFINSTTGTYGGAISISDCGSVKIVNSTFTNNNGRGGGAIYSRSVADINVTNCTFEKNHAAIGGAIYATYNTMFILNSTFIENDVTDSNGGAIHASLDNSKYVNCTFIGNVAKDSNAGAIAYSYGPGAIEGCRFINNSARTGGALYLECNDVFPITNCIFEGNIAVDNGGAVNLVNAGIVTDSNFTNNSAKNGGAIFASSEDKTLKIINSSFNRNVAIMGGALFAKNGTSVNHTLFEGNVAQNGSAIYLTKEANIIANSVFLNNKANSTLLDCIVESDGLFITFSGGNNYLNAIYSNEEIAISNVTYYNGGINNSDVIIPIYNTSPGQNITIELYCDNILAYNMTLKTGNDGKLFFSYPNISTGNYAYRIYHRDDCYYTYIEKKGNFKFGEFDLLQILINNASENSTINLTRNYTYIIGLDTITEGIEINKRNLTINGNGYTINALEQSRIFHVSEENVSLKNISFINTNGKEAILIDGNAVNFEIECCKFENNSNDGGGAIKLYAKNSKIKNSYFKNNKAGMGGAIFMIANYVLISNCTFEKNAQRAIYGGGDYNTIENCNFINNSAESFGGAIDFGGNYGTIKNCNFTDNHALYGGTIFIDCANTNVVNCSFKNNYASDGGALELNKNNISIAGCDFTGNHAGYGGAIESKNNNISIAGCNFTGNHASYGGAIYIGGEEGYYIDRSSFINNSADNEGGAINSFAHSITISNSVFLKNKAPTTNIMVRMNEIGQLVITFEGNDNYINAIHTFDDPEVINVTYWNGETVNTDDVKPMRRNCPGVKITLEVFNHEARLADNVTLTVDGENKVYYDTGKLEDGNYYIKAHHFEDDYYTYFMGNISIGINRAPSQVSINMTDKQEFYYGDCNISFNISNRTVSRVVITNMDGSVEYINQQIDKNYIIVNLPANDEYYNITVYNLGNISYSPSQDSKLFKILKLISKVNIDPIDDVVYGNNTSVGFNVANRVNVNATVYDENKIIVFTQIVSGNTVEVPILPVGRYNITIINMGGDNVLGSKNSTLFNVVKANNTVRVKVNDIIYGNEAIVTIMGVDGEYVIDVNGTYKTITVRNGKGDERFILAAGTYYANATFNNPNYNTFIINATFNVFKANSTVIVTPISAADYGDAIEVTFDGDNMTSVNVTVYDKDGTIVFNKIVSENNLTLPILPVGQYNLTVINLGDENHTASKNSTVFNINQKANNVKVIVDDVTYPDEAIVIIEADFDGVYKIDVNGTIHTVNVANGRGNTLFNLSAGYYYANATFDNPNCNSTITNDTFSVFKNDDCPMDVTVDDAVEGENAVVTVKLPADATGNVTVSLGGKNYTVSVKNGEAIITFPTLSPGDVSANVTYSGNQNYSRKEIEIAIHVQTVTISAVDAKYGWSSSITYQAKLIDEKGNGIPDKQMTFLIGGKTYNATTNNQGIATISLSLDVGSYNVEINIPIKNITKKITVVARLTENKNMVMDYLDGSNYKVRAIDDNGNPVGSGTVVKIKVNGKTYSVKTDKNGYAKLKINLKPKTYTITATYKGYTVKNKIKIKYTLKAKKTFSVKRSAKKLILKAKLIWSNGKPIVGKKVTFKFKGKTYKAKTNKKGIAKVTIKKNVIKKLKVGKKYNVKISYKYEKVISKVNVKK